jgi:hypothetical protein
VVEHLNGNIHLARARKSETQSDGWKPFASDTFIRHLNSCLISGLACDDEKKCGKAGFIVSEDFLKKKIFNPIQNLISLQDVFIIKNANFKYLTYVNFFLPFPTSQPTDRSPGQAWLWHILVEIKGGGTRLYSPKNDCGVWLDGIPRLIVEVESSGTKKFCSDYDRLFFQGGAIVRLATTILGDSQSHKFVLLAIYFWRQGLAQMFLFYYDKDRDNSEEKTAVSGLTDIHRHHPRRVNR